MRYVISSECSKYDVWPWQNTAQALVAVVVGVACIILLIWAIDRWL